MAGTPGFAYLGKFENAGVRGDQSSRPLSPAEYDMYQYFYTTFADNVDKWWWQAKFARLAAGMVATIYSNIIGPDGQDQILSTPPGAAVIQRAEQFETTDGQKGVGFLTDGFTLVGSDNMCLPPPPWTVALLTMNPLAHNGFMFCTDNGLLNGQVSLETTTDDRWRFCSPYDATTANAIAGRSGPGWNTAQPCLVIVERDTSGNAPVIRRMNKASAGSLVTMAYSGTVPTNFALNARQKIRFGTINDSVNGYDNPYDGYYEQGFCIPAIDPVFRSKLLAISLEVHPSWAVA